MQAANQSESMHRAGFVTIIGNPNVGKSTMMNRLVGERLSIVTNKSQTTRHRIFGIVDTPQYQIVYSDTPGIIAPAYALQKTMRQAVEDTLEDSDLLLYMTDVVENPEKHSDLLARIVNSGIPTILLINKIDLTDQSTLEKLVAQWQSIMPRAEILPIAALHGFGIEHIQSKILQMLPEGPKYYPPETLTDRPVRFFVSEIIREKILLHCHQEVPYSVEVSIRDYQESAEFDRIEAIIFVARDSQKGILIGKAGKKLKSIGIDARKEIEKFLQKRVFLSLRVQVAKNWRDDDEQLRKFGYLD